MTGLKNFDLRLIKPDWDSELADIILQLDRLRHNWLRGTTPRYIFFQIKRIFHSMESLGSARIEGNHTTLADYIEETQQSGTASSLLTRGAGSLAVFCYCIDAVQPGMAMTAKGDGPRSPSDLGLALMRDIDLVTIDWGYAHGR